ncbi:hypothetical protein [Sphingobium cupriresistens]|uniref:hypothetical protein n=1 Tax=Sphingobium cupriresistens TaxID=1132417 RepID=UPI003BF53726
MTPRIARSRWRGYYLQSVSVTLAGALLTTSSGPPGRAVIRALDNAPALAAWARDEGFRDLRPSFWHVTVIFSPHSLLALDPDALQIESGSSRRVERMGGLITLCIPSPALVARHLAHRQSGGVWDFRAYIPHVSFTPDDGRNLRDVRPFDGMLMFGPEILG